LVRAEFYARRATAPNEFSGMTVLRQSDDAHAREAARKAADPASAGGGWIVFAAISGAASVIAGAFAAHALDAATEAAEIGWLHTGSQYEALHALTILAVVALTQGGRIGGRGAILAQWLFAAGNIFFPLALYGLAFHFPRWLGAVAPLGGSAYILGWFSLAAAAFARPRSSGVTR
jgi:uncharacterized membrane protein YgdD (TMEM256/DUF423 family)